MTRSGTKFSCRDFSFFFLTKNIFTIKFSFQEKTGGKVIHRQGGSIFLFRGRHYNYKDRPRYPLMLWRPISPVYPRLVKRVPDGLTLEEANELRKRGRDIPPILKLGTMYTFIKFSMFNIIHAF